MVVPGYWQWKKYGEVVTSPTQRYAVTPIVMLYPNLLYGLLMSDLEAGKDAVCAGWTGESPWESDIRWTANDRLRIEYYQPDSLDWGMRTEVLGAKIDWVPVVRPGK